LWFYQHKRKTWREQLRRSEKFVENGLPPYTGSVDWNAAFQTKGTGHTSTLRLPSGARVQGSGHRSKVVTLERATAERLDLCRKSVPTKPCSVDWKAAAVR
jgi:hypothetical protein